MKKIIPLLLFSFGLSIAIAGQTVPSSIKREITALLKSHDSLCEDANATVRIEAVKITPQKLGYMGSCKYGGGPDVLFEKTASGYQKLISVDTGMNGYFYREKSLTKGYYDFSNSERGGNEVEITTYKWNGTRYVAGPPKTTLVP